jgi:hypothetical protein
MNMHASVPMSRAKSSVTITMTSGKAQAQVHAQEPARKKLQVRRRPTALVLLLQSPGEDS